MAMGLTCHGALQAEKKVLYLSVNVFRMCQCILCLLLETGPVHFTRSSKPRKGPATVALLLVKLTSLPPPQNNEG